MPLASRWTAWLTVTLEDAELVAQKSALRYDRDGDDHYDIAVRFAEVHARLVTQTQALHYLARLLEAGDLVSACRRLMVIASRGCGVGLSSSGVHCEILH